MKPPLSRMIALVINNKLFYDKYLGYKETIVREVAKVNNFKNLKTKTKLIIEECLESVNRTLESFIV